MGTHVVDDRHQVELRGTVAPVGRRKPPKRTTNPVAERAPIQIDPLPFEDPGLTVERQMIPELCDDGEPSWRHRFKPDGERRWTTPWAARRARHARALAPARQGYIARGGQILDASIVPVPRNHNTRDENAAIKKGEVPEDWENKPAKRCQKELAAR